MRPQAALLPPALTRRHALQLMAASMALAGGACSRAAERAHLPLRRHARGRRRRRAGVLRQRVRPRRLRARACWWRRRRAGRSRSRAIRRTRPASAPPTCSRRPRCCSCGIRTASPRCDSASRQRSPPRRRGNAWHRHRLPRRPRAGPRSRPLGTRASRALLADGGARLRVLTGPVTSPTERAQIEQLLQRYPAARWHVTRRWPTPPPTQPRALAFGRPWQPVQHFDRAALRRWRWPPIRSATGPAPCARRWTGRRARALGRAAGAAALLAAETAPGLFGARADHRLALPPAAIEALLWRLAPRCSRQSGRGGSAGRPTRRRRSRRGSSPRCARAGADAC